jgi:ribonuclease-3
MSRRGDAELDALERRLGYAFRDQKKLATAVTHGSAIASGRAHGESYQRFEFLGDRVLALIVSEMLVITYPEAPEGELSQRLADLVRKETCAEVASNLGMGGALRTSGGKHAQALLTTNVLGDVCEAVIAAIYLDGGIEPARRFVSENWRARMEVGPPLSRNAKAALQEWAQGRGHPAPTYAIVERTGPDHSVTFDVEVTVAGLAPARGTGRTRRDAEQAAASAALLREGVWKATAIE